MATVSWKSIGKHNSFELEDEDDPETKDDYDTFRKWLEEQESGETVQPPSGTSRGVSPERSCDKCHKMIKECNLDDKLRTIYLKCIHGKKQDNLWVIYVSYISSL